jgi:hypothetical protein
MELVGQAKPKIVLFRGKRFSISGLRMRIAMSPGQKGWKESDGPSNPDRGCK